jgi:hypothetical protein
VITEGAAGNISKAGRRSAVPHLWASGAWLVGALWFFRDQWDTGFHKLNGDGGDSAFIVYILEHWFRVIHGQASWANPAIFYPYKGILGWSDGLILFEVIYAPLRWLGFDELLAAQIMLVIASLIGFLTFVALVRRLFDPPLLIALAGGLVFTFANGMYYQIDHYQLVAVWFLPGIALLGIEAWRSTSRVRSCVFGALAGGLYGLLFFTSFYIAWFCIPLAAIAMVVAVVLRARRFRMAFISEVGRLWPAVASAAGAFLIALIPFAEVYLPVQGKVPSASYQFVIAAYAHSIHGAFDLGGSNLMWSSTLNHFHAVFSPDQDSAITPILLAGSVVLAVVALVASRRRHGLLAPAAIFATAFAAAAAIAFVLPVRYHGHSLWILMWDLPGGTAIRAIWRVGLMSSAMAIASLIASVSELWTYRVRGRRSYLRPILAAIVLLVVLEQVNVGNFARFERPQTLAFLDSVPKPPAGCKSFYMNYTKGSPVPVFAFQMDAILLAQKLDLPTIDGYTGYDPPNWNLVGVFGNQLDTDAERWAQRYQLTGVCRLDVSDMVWTPLGG